MSKYHILFLLALLPGCKGCGGPTSDDSSYRLGTINHGSEARTLEDFGAVGDGVANDRSAIAAALSAAAAEHFVLTGSGRYWLGSISGDEVMFDAIADHLTVDFTGARFELRSTSGGPIVFRLRRPNALTFYFGTVSDLNAVSDSTRVQGARAVQLYGEGNGVGRDIAIKGRTEHTLECLETDGDEASERGIGYRMENISIELYPRDTFYGAVFHNIGDDVRGVIDGSNNGRLYAASGVHDHDLVIHVHRDENDNAQPASNGLIKSNDDWRDSSNIKLRIIASGDLSHYTALASFGVRELYGTGPRSKTHYNYYIDTRAVTRFAPGFFAIDLEGWTWEEGPDCYLRPDKQNCHTINLPVTTSIWDDVTIDGEMPNYPAGATLLGAYTRPAVPGRLILGPGVSHIPDGASGAFAVTRRN